MKLEKLFSMRYSVRRFDSRPIEQKKLDKILQAGQLAPSAQNNQSWRVLVLRSKTALEKLKACTPCHYHAPLALLVCGNTETQFCRQEGEQGSAPIDAAIAATHMMLMATDLGVGSCWVMNFDPEKIRATFHIPQNLQPTALLVCGYPREDSVINPRHTQTLALDQLVAVDDFDAADRPDETAAES